MFSLFVDDAVAVVVDTVVDLRGVGVDCGICGGTIADYFGVAFG